MRAQDSAIRPTAIAVGAQATSSSTTVGSLLAASGVFAFSFSFPATAWALQGFGPWSSTALRGLLAAVTAAVCLLAARAPLPARRHWPGLLAVAGGCVLGFPLLTTFAVQASSTAHTAVVVGLLPLCTAVVATVRTGARPPRAFWVAALAGAAVVLAFTLQQSHGSFSTADLFLFAALAVCAVGYAEGGRLAKELPGWQVIAWGVLIALPVMLPAALLALAAEPVHLGWHAVTGLAYQGLVSQFGGFVVWYRGMGQIGVPKASQFQLAQPLLTLVWATVLLGEHLTPAAPLTAVAVLGCIAATQRARG
ncbi:DMT family transporter [Kitasatospora sp. NPDC002227]|uniref:DMT family transporter n=1 Tax=Kitasatospora sp. NPDC002227 TaxID=3154773 RepID=UPI003318FCF1